HDRSYVISTYDLLLRDEHFAHSAVPELVLRFGEMPTSKPLRGWLGASGAEELVVDPYGDWNDPANRAAAILRADPTELAAGWAARLESEARPAPKRWLDAERAAAECLATELAGSEEITEPALHWALGDAHRDGEIVYTASSMPIRDQEAFLPGGTTDSRFLCNRGANGIDGLISSAAGAAQASARPTTVITGDLGLLHDIGGLAAVRDADAPVRVLVIDNGGGGIFHFLPQAEALERGEFEALLGTPRGVSTAKAAELFDLPHRPVHSLGELPAALAGGSAVIEVKTDRGTNTAHHRQLAERVAAALPGS
ncbi:MAG TPA: thiamine pyrophosphate-dependent enzyme, partial [Solirubrobacterales bacterium]|nr:thiamine pyrophosphate-dependent enzyme [Solirubrobacterales bacterium]